MKGIILCGGFGTRLFPATKVTNKHLLPVFDRPMIYYPLETLIKAGIKEILIVAGIEHAGDFLKLLGDGTEFIKELNTLNKTEYGRIRLHYTVQKGAGGIAEALGLAEDFADNEPVTVILGDNIFQDDISEAVKKFKPAGWMVDRQAGSHVMLVKIGYLYTLSIPQHKELGIGLLKKLIKQASLSVDEFNAL